VIEQITKQLNKLIDVVDVLDITLHDHVERELIMIKFKVKEQQRELLENILSDHSAETISDHNGFVIVEAMDDWEANSDFLKSIEALAEIIAVARSGPLALAKEEPIISV
jgi:acetolactate synthase-1/3 small subunit